MTLVFIRHTQIGDHLYHHGDELPPDTLSQAEVDKAVDQGWLREYLQRRSLYRLLASFSGSKEHEGLDKHEREAYTLPL